MSLTATEQFLLMIGHHASVQNMEVEQIRNGLRIALNAADRSSTLDEFATLMVMQADQLHTESAAITPSNGIAK